MSAVLFEQQRFARRNSPISLCIFAPQNKMAADAMFRGEAPVAEPPLAAAEWVAAGLLLAILLGTFLRVTSACTNWMEGLLRWHQHDEKMPVGKPVAVARSSSGAAPLEEQLATVLRREADLNAALGHVRTRASRLKHKLGQVEEPSTVRMSSAAKVGAGYDPRAVVPDLPTPPVTAARQEVAAARQAILLRAAALQAVASRAASEAAAARAVALEAAADAAAAREAASQAAADEWAEAAAAAAMAGRAEALLWGAADPVGGEAQGAEAEAEAALHEMDGLGASEGGWIPLGEWGGLSDGSTSADEMDVLEAPAASHRPAGSPPGCLLAPDAASLPAPPFAFLAAASAREDDSRHRESRHRESCKAASRRG